MNAEAGPLLAFLLGERPKVLSVADVPSFVQATVPHRARFRSTVSRALAQGFVADRVGFAFAGGYQAALQALVPSLGIHELASFCVTEEAGNHPRSISTSLDAAGDGFVLRGKKKWSTLAPVADVLLVVARSATAPDGRPVLRAVEVRAGAPGLTVTTMPPTPFVPEVPHAELTFAGVPIEPAAVLGGDGYDDYTKAFRTLEDLHVNAALIGYLLSLSLRHEWPRELCERLTLLAVAAAALSFAAPKAPEVHVALAGLLGSVGALVGDAASSVERLPDAERERWNRDQVLFHVAGKAREARRSRAWELVRATGENP